MVQAINKMYTLATICL